MRPKQADRLKPGQIVEAWFAGHRITAAVLSVHRLSGTRLRSIGIQFTNANGIQISTTVLHSQVSKLNGK